MTLYKKCLVLTTEALIGEQSILPQKSWLDTSIILSKMKILYKVRQKKDETMFNIVDYLTTITNNQKLYPLLILEILYLVNFKKKFSQRNVNRIAENYFKIVFLSVTKKINMATVPEPIVTDLNYLTTLSLCNLYTISKFHYDQK